MRQNMDSTDEKIIKILQENARTTIKDIASQVYLSSPAVTARMERLEERGILAGYHAQIAPEAFGYRIRAFINLALEPRMRQQFSAFIDAVPNVIECNSVTGGCEMLMQVAFADTEELEAFGSRLQQFGRTHTQIVFSTVVEHRGLPVKCPA